MNALTIAEGIMVAGVCNRRDWSRNTPKDAHSARPEGVHRARTIKTINTTTAIVPSKP